MSFKGLSYLFRKYALVRGGLVVVVIAAVFGISFFFANRMNQSPRILSLEPAVGFPGDTIVVRGAFFGDEQGNGFIEIAGSRLTGSSYRSWSDTEISAVLPYGVQNGLVYVVTKGGRSEPVIFANKTSIPVQVQPMQDTGVPVILAVKEQKVPIGGAVTITGRNFGSSRNGSQVFFAWAAEGGSTLSAQSAQSGRDDGLDRFIPCSESDFDYEFWSDEEIRVRVPDGAVSGSLYVSLQKENSNREYIEITDKPGIKAFADRRRYIVSLSVDVTDTAAAGEDNVLFLRVPRPPVTASQREVELSLSNREPFLPNYMNAILYQFEDVKSQERASAELRFLVTTYGVQTQVTPRLVKDYSGKSRSLFAQYTRPDELVPSGDSAVTALLPAIVGRERNSWTKAQAVYSWLLDEVALLPEVRSSEANPLEALGLREGDAYDMAVLFCAFARAAGIPAVPVSGILLDRDSVSRVHWWAEFYVENFGWVPVDPALGAGMAYTPFQERESNRSFYFGNLDGQHIVFSRGLSVQKPMVPWGRSVIRSRSYAFQSIWEESAGDIERYTSLWRDPKVDGFY
ncbi:MAG: IPT/TIG domain-containing protein [Spirochaetaceae bacterium]|jgi:transglutaminase-like putative cysteine protease|nr:IPT/TIG domain-containing protein [Spirochaetaceae bacterium]